MAAAAIQRAAFDATARAMNELQGDVLRIHDTTRVSPVHALREALRTKPGSPAGYEVHTGLAVKADAGVPIGVLGQLTWCRKTKQSARLFELEREKWQRLDAQLPARDMDQARLIRGADRASDCYSCKFGPTRTTLQRRRRRSWRCQKLKDCGPKPNVHVALRKSRHASGPISPSQKSLGGKTVRALDASPSKHVGVACKCWRRWQRAG